MKKKSRSKQVLNKKIFSKNSVIIFITAIFIVVSFFAFAFYAYNRAHPSLKEQIALNPKDKSAILLELEKKVINKKGFTLKIRWGNLGRKMIEDGVISKDKLAKALNIKGDFPKSFDKYFTSEQNGIELNNQTQQFWLYVLWGLGLSNKNEILENGPMSDGGNAYIYSSTAGWGIGDKDISSLYSNFSYIRLSSSQQKMVKEIADSVYRPCCNNPASFPDCNHGMADLALIELMASQNFSADDIYKTLLAFNTYWFSRTFLDSAYYLESKGRDYNSVSPKELLSKTYLSASGYRATFKKVGDLQWPGFLSGSNC